MTGTGFKSRDQRVVARMERDFLDAAHRRLREGVPVPSIVRYLTYANVALNEKRADLGLLDRCAGCKVPVTGAPVFDDREDYRSLVPERWKRWHSEACRDQDLARGRRAVA